MREQKVNDRLEAALSAIDAMHAQDSERLDGVPAELRYAERMTEALSKLAPNASDTLRIAVRAQHLMRWRIPRSEYPRGRSGYLSWRTAQAKAHAELAADAMRSAGYEDAMIERVQHLVRKKGLARDPEAQVVEDAACLVFLEHELAGFAAGRDEATVIEILRKTWRKMSERGRALALELPLDDQTRTLVARALASG